MKKITPMKRYSNAFQQLQNIVPRTTNYRFKLLNDTSQTSNFFIYHKLYFKRDTAPTCTYLFYDYKNKLNFFGFSFFISNKDEDKIVPFFKKDGDKEITLLKEDNFNTRLNYVTRKYQVTNEDFISLFIDSFSVDTPTDLKDVNQTFFKESNAVLETFIQQEHLLKTQLNEITHTLSKSQTEVKSFVTSLPEKDILKILQEEVNKLKSKMYKIQQEVNKKKSQKEEELNIKKLQSSKYDTDKKLKEIKIKKRDIIKKTR